ncbi:MAG: lytic murein transglycosylase [Thermodesulfobacteriota bacterium]|nr:lytic murein transglycosylase [Thermodesulfobacteriota bacterium]
MRIRSWLRIGSLFIFTGVLWFFICSPAKSEKQQLGFTKWLEDFRKEASASGVSQKTLDSAFTNIELIPRVIELDRNQPEFKLTLKEYLHKILYEDRITKAQAQLRENQTLLKRITKRYGLQPRFLIALWGIETNFGHSTGDFPVISSLTTLAYDVRRSSYFRKELLYALRILDRGDISLAQMKGSWAGAMGQLQFLPSTFFHYAVDFNNDGCIDLWKDKEDIFASAANYLSQSGWKGDQLWGREVQLPDDRDEVIMGLNHQKRIGEWQTLGIRLMDGRDLPQYNLLASIIQPDGQDGQAFMVYSNYRTLLKWNRSHWFAITVGILSDRIRLTGK